MTIEQIRIVNSIKLSILNAIDNIELEQMWEMIEKAYEQKEKEHCEDCISREDTLNKINALIAEYIPLMTTGWTLPLNIAKTINELPPVTPKGVTITDFADRCRECGRIKSCEDCISREQAIRATYGFERYTGIDEAPYEYAESILRDLPSVTPSISDVENDFNLGYNCGYADAMIDIAEGSDS